MMSAIYDEYINNHKANVANAFNWLHKNLPEIFPDEAAKVVAEYQCVSEHDKSKYDKDEYEAYDNYFYGNRSYEVVQSFKYAWLRHIHKNPHHWQYWVLTNDDKKLGTEPLEMPFVYIIEMICDWWSFSWKSGNLYEIFDWYNDHKDGMIIHMETRKTIEDILDKIHNKLDDVYEK